MNLIGKRIKEMRLAQSPKMSQQILADKVRVSRATVSQWEIGDIKNLRPANLLAVADTLGVSFRWLITGHGQRQRTRQENAEALASKNSLKQESLNLAQQIESLPPEAREQVRQFINLQVMMIQANQRRDFMDPLKNLHNQLEQMMRELHEIKSKHRSV